MEKKFNLDTHFCQVRSTPPSPGTIVRNDPNYFSRFGVVDHFELLEMHRPEGKLTHRDSLVMTTFDEIDNLEEGEWIWELHLPDGARIESHDVYWSNKILILSSCPIANKERIRIAAEKYWHGIPSRSPRWEHFTPCAVVGVGHQIT